MKRRIRSLLLAVVTVLTMLASCGGGDNGGTDDGNKPDTPQGDGLVSVYAPGDELYLVVNSDVARYAEAVSQAVHSVRGTAVKRRDDSSEKQAHEIVLGDTSRPISSMAMEIFSETSYDSDTAAYLIYASGGSIALVWNNLLGMEKGIEALTSQVITSDSLRLKENYMLSGTASVSEREAELWAEEIADLYTVFDAETVVVIEKLYTLYGDHLYKYIAALYDPDIGGFYYSNSARDNEPFLPDLESTSRALNFLKGAGMFDDYSSYAEAIDADVVAKIGSFVYELQAEDGYFYHPQWGTSINTSRRGRDLSNASSILSTLGITPKYKLATDQIADGTDLVSAVLTGRLASSASLAVSAVIAADGENNVPDYLSSEEKFIEYLDSLDFKNDSYASGHQLSATSTQIKAAGLGPVAVAYLDKLQNTENGFWEDDVNYESLSGFLKISSAYQSFGGHIKHIDKAVESVLVMIYDEEEPRQIAQVYNLMNSFVNIINNLIRQKDEAMITTVRQNLKENSARIANKLYEKLVIFLRDDGTLSYYPDRNSKVSQGCTVALECVEGDMGGLSMLSGAISGFFKIMNAESVKPRVFTAYDLEVFNNIVANAESVEKIVLPPPEVMDMEDGVLPTWVTSNLRSDGSSIGIVEDDREGSNYTGYITSYPGGGDYLKVSVAGTTAAAHTALIAEADIRIASCTTSGTMMQIAILNAYMLQLNVSGGKISFSEITATSGSDRYMSDIGVTKKVGEWFNLRMEYYVGDVDTTRIKVFIDGEHVLTSKNYYGRKPSLENTGDQKEPADSFTTFQFFCLNASNITTHIDNIYVDRSADVYDGVGEPEELPDYAVVEDFESEELSSLISTTIASEGGSGTVVDDPREGSDGHVFQLVTKPELADKIKLSPGGVSVSDNPTCFVTEAEVAFVNITSNEVRCRLVSGNYFSIDVTFGETGVSFSKRDSVDYFATAEYGEWVKIRVENYISLGVAGTVYVYVNDELVSKDVATTVNPTLTGLELSTLKAADHISYIDNMFVDSTDATIAGEGGDEDDDEPVIGEGIDFNGSSELPEGITTDFKSTGGAVHIIGDPRENRGGNVLMFATASGGMDKVIVSASGTGTCYVLETDLMHAEGSQTGVMARITLGNFYNIAIRHDSDGTLTFVNNTTNSTKYSTYNRGEWLKLRIECYALGGDTFTAKIFVNDQFMVEETVTKAEATFTSVTFSCLSKANHITYLDDIVIEVTDATYAPETPSEPETPVEPPVDPDTPVEPPVDPDTPAEPEVPTNGALTFDTDTLPEGITTDFKSTGAALSAVKDEREGATGNVLMLTTASGGMDKVIVSASGTGSCYVLETDLMHVDGNQTGVMARVTIGNFYNIAIRHDSNGTLTFVNNSATSTKYNTYDRGEWIRLRIECYALGGDTFTAKIFVNDQFMVEETVTKAEATFTSVTFSCLSKANHITYLDNIAIEVTDATYAPEVSEG